jgi:PhnB protein
MIYLYVEDIDAVYQRAIQAGATSVKEPANQFYGDRSAGVTDPVGNYWGIATRVEDVSPEELEKRAAAFAKQSAAS